MTLSDKINKINQKNKRQDNKATANITWLEQATAKNNKFASVKVYSK